MAVDNKNVEPAEAKLTRDEIKSNIFKSLIKKRGQGFSYEKPGCDPLSDILGFDKCNDELLKAFLIKFIDENFVNNDTNDEKDVLYMCFGFLGGRYIKLNGKKQLMKRREFYVADSDHVEIFEKGKPDLWDGLELEDKRERAVNNLCNKNGEKKIIERLSSKLAGLRYRGTLSLDVEELEGRYYISKDNCALLQTPSYLARKKKKLTCSTEDSETQGEVSDVLTEDSSVERYSNLPMENTHFHGRKEQLEEIRIGLNENRIQIISGLGGVGKTQIALKYAYLNTENYDVICWLTDDLLFQSADDFVAYMEPKKYRELKNPQNNSPIIAAFREWFENPEHSKWLLIFDNVDNDDGGENTKLIKDYLPRKINGDILLTSRLSHNWKWNVVSLDVFDKDTAVEFLLKRTGKDDAENTAIVAERLGNLPLALEQAAAYILNNSMDFAKYLMLLEKHGLKVFKYFDDSVRTTWEISMEKIKKDSAKQLLYLCSYFAADDIKLSYFIDMAKICGKGVLPDSLRMDLLDELESDELIRELTEYSLVKFDRKPQTLSIHRLLQEVVRDDIKIKNTSRYIECCFSIMREVERKLDIDEMLEAGNHEYFYRNILPNVNSIAKHAESFGRQTPHSEDDW
ncbi:MAG: hypothetical protein LBD23_19685 [Oscillospiraceae bacterium]|nr:hypothetical protein [Oscillospiraceae bacterium]